MNKLKGFKNKIAAALATVSGALLASPVFAEGAGANPIDNGASALESLTSTISKASFFVFVFMLVIIGVMFAIGDEGKRRAMGWLPNVIIGICIVAAATSIVSFVISLMA